MIGALSDVGNVRKINEDNIGYYDGGDKKIYIVADGIGGHNAGEVASKIAVEKTIEFIKSVEIWDDINDILRKAITLANEEIYRHSLSDKGLTGMGTTLTACLKCEDKIFVVNIGDSSCFMIRDNDIIKITKDHSLVQELVDEGSITEEQARTHPNRNVITRALGTGSKVEADIYELPLDGIRKIVLCTDGLTDEVTAQEILECTERNSEDLMACKELIEMAKARGGRDNISVMIFEGECKDDRNNSEQ